MGVVARDGEIGSSDPRGGAAVSTVYGGPLAGLRIVAVEQYGAGPWATLQLADLGADVIKVEDVHDAGDIGRRVPPFVDGDSSLFFEALNRNKRSIALDLRTGAGMQVLHQLVRHSDVVFSNLRGDVPERLGIRFDDLRAFNPSIVCCSLSGYGMTGPRAADAGYDYLVQGLAGWMSLNGGPTDQPMKTGLSLVDFSAGFVAAAGMLAGVLAARRDGIGCDVDLSLFDTAISLTNYLATWQLSAGVAPVRQQDSAHPSIVPFGNFLASDGWIVVACPKDKFWERLVTVIEEDTLQNDVFATMAGRMEHRIEVLDTLRAAFVRRSVADWLTALRQAGVPCAPVNDLAAAMREEQVAARGLIVETEHPRFGTVRSPVSPLRVGDRSIEHRRAPGLSEHADEVLRGVLGLDDGAIGALVQEGAFGQAGRDGSVMSHQNENRAALGRAAPEPT